MFKPQESREVDLAAQLLFSLTLDLQVMLRKWQEEAERDYMTYPLFDMFTSFVARERERQETGEGC